MPRQKYNYYTYKVINKINNKNKFPLLFSRFVWICRGRDGGYSMKSFFRIGYEFSKKMWNISESLVAVWWPASGS